MRFINVTHCSGLELEASVGRLSAEEHGPADTAELDASDTAAHHDAVGSELGDPELAGELTIVSEGEGDVVSSPAVGKDVSTASGAGFSKDADAGEDEAGEHGDTSAAEASKEADGKRAADEGSTEADGVDQVHGEVELVDGGPASATFTNAGKTLAKVIVVSDISGLIVVVGLVEEGRVIERDSKGAGESHAGEAAGAKNHRNTFSSHL